MYLLEPASKDGTVKTHHITTIESRVTVWRFEEGNGSARNSERVAPWLLHLDWDV